MCYYAYSFSFEKFIFGVEDCLLAGWQLGIVQADIELQFLQYKYLWSENLNVFFRNDPEFSLYSKILMRKLKLLQMCR